MKCILNPEIENISGKIGGLLYRTYKRPNGKTETRAYLLPRKQNGSYGYERKTPLSDNEITARNRFAQAAEYFKNLSNEQKQRYCKEFSRNKYTFNGKKKPVPRYDFRYRFEDKWELKKPHNILLVNPVCMEIRYVGRNGDERIVGTGEFIGDIEIQPLSRLAEKISADRRMPE